MYASSLIARTVREMKEDRRNRVVCLEGLNECEPNTVSRRSCVLGLAPTGRASRCARLHQSAKVGVCLREHAFVDRIFEGVNVAGSKNSQR